MDSAELHGDVLVPGGVGDALERRLQDVAQAIDPQVEHHLAAPAAIELEQIVDQPDLKQRVTPDDLAPCATRGDWPSAAMIPLQPRIAQHLRVLVVVHRGGLVILHERDQRVKKSRNTRPVVPRLDP